MRDLRVIRSGDLGRLIPGQKGAPRGQKDKLRFEVIFRKTMPATEGVFEPFPASVPKAVVDLLMLGGARTPYCHQSEAARLSLDEGRNVALVTATASGKTVSFLAPVLSILQTKPKATGIMIYPMNALAEDQLKNLEDMGFVPEPSMPGILRYALGDQEIFAGVLMGGVDEATRKIIRERANLLITNHVALHAAILAQANRVYADGTSWTRFLSGLRVVVLDELHSYNGWEGTNAAFVFRRLFALTEALSRRTPQVILATATIGNPEEHARNVTGLGNWALVTKSGARSFQRDYEIVVPVDHPGGEGRWHASVVALDLIAQEISLGRRVLAFCPNRPGTEKMADRLNEIMKQKIATAFHAGLPKSNKKTAIRMILRGEAQAVFSTSALELGVDIGGMDTVVLVGHPGDNASFTQRAGRVGRTRDGRVVLVLDDAQNPLNTYLESNPEALFWEPENRTVFPGNQVVATRHAACALVESKDENFVKRWFPNVSVEVVRDAALDDPHEKISMIGIGNFGQFKAISPDGTELQMLNGQDALTNWHKGAVIRSPLGGEFFRVVRLDLDGMAAITAPAGFHRNRRVYTSPIVQTYFDLVVADIDPPKIGLKGVESARSGVFDIRRQTIAYKEFSYGGGESSDDIAIGLSLEDRNPAMGFKTRGIEFTLGGEHPLNKLVFQSIGGANLVRNALGLAVPFLVQARCLDVPIEVTSSQNGMKILLYDLADGGMGWADTIGTRLAKLFYVAGNALLKCRCQLEGCPRCSCSVMRGDERKAMALTMVRTGMGR